MLNGQGTGRQRQRVFAVLVAMIVVGAAGCVVRDKAQGIVNSTDRDNFSSSVQSFTKAERAFAATVTANNANPDPVAFAAAATGPIDAMKHAAAQMGTLADRVTGNAHEIATTAWQAATGMVGAAEREVFANSARNNDMIEAANKDATNSVNEFNQQRDRWNAL